MESCSIDAARIAALLTPTLQDRFSDQLSEIYTTKVKNNRSAGLQSQHQILEHLENFEKREKKTEDNKPKNYHQVATESTDEEKKQNVMEDDLKSTNKKTTGSKKFQPRENAPNNKNNSRRNERIAKFRQLDQTYFTKQHIEKENNKFDKVQTNKQSSLVRVKRYNIKVERDMSKSQLRSRMFQRHLDNQNIQSARVYSSKNGHYPANRPFGGFVSRAALSKSRAERNRQLQRVYNSVKRRHGTGSSTAEDGEIEVRISLLNCLVKSGPIILEQVQERCLLVLAERKGVNECSRQINVPVKDDKQHTTRVVMRYVCDDMCHKNSWLLKHNTLDEMCEVMVVTEKRKMTSNTVELDGVERLGEHVTRRNKDIECKRDKESMLAVTRRNMDIECKRDKERMLAVTRRNRIRSEVILERLALHEIVERWEEQITESVQV
uniref:(California timema) hypothetical protein n=1 Tax=Timema californicum TaxID=61474 RepID=A0A7R9P7T1_TIMCA|nr:unnamed protein product [Timema californicum]